MQGKNSERTSTVQDDKQAREHSYQSLVCFIHKLFPNEQDGYATKKHQKFQFIDAFIAIKGKGNTFRE